MGVNSAELSQRSGREVPAVPDPDLEIRGPGPVSRKSRFSKVTCKIEASIAGHLT